jgi:hypothetical protein
MDDAAEIEVVSAPWTDGMRGNSCGQTSRLAMLLWIGCLATGCERPSMSGSLSMSKDDLEQAYRTHEPLFAGHQSAEAVVVGPEGITVLARANPAGECEHTWLLHLSLDGVVAWKRHYDPKYGAGRAITRLARGGFAIAGDVQRDAMAYQASLLQVDAAGEVVGATSLGPRGVTGFNTIQARADGTIVAGGSSAWKGWLVTTDRTLRNPGERALAVEEIKAIRLLPSGDIAALVSIEKSTSGFGLAQLTSIATDGKVRWQRPLPTNGRGDPAALVVRQDGEFVMGTGAPTERDPAHVWLAYVDPAGNVAWERTLTATATARGRAAAALPDGYAVAGETATADGERMPHVWRLGGDGSPRWDQSYQGPGGGQAFEIVNGLDATSDGGLVMVGSTTRGPGKTNVWIVRLAPDGTVLWQRVFGAAANPA